MPVESQTLLLLSPAAILIAAFITWLWHRKIASRDATLKFIAEKEIHNSKWNEAKRKFYDWVKTDSPKTDSVETLAPIYLVLHHYELVAVGIKNKSVDEKLYKRWNRTSYVNTWKRASSFVHGRREKTGQKTMFCEFEELATKWDRQNQ